MALPSPICTVQDGAGAPQSTVNGAVVTAGNVVTVTLTSTAGVNNWNLTLFGQDEVINPVPVVTVNNTNKTATFTAPALPWSLIYKSTVNSGVDINGVTQGALSTTFKICCLTAAGKRLAASNETQENNATLGWTGILNDSTRSGAATTMWIDMSLPPYSMVADADRIGGGTDNTPKFQLALTNAAAAGGAFIVVPKGYYRFAASASRPGIAVLVNKRIKVLGSGQDQYGEGTTFCVDSGVSWGEINAYAGQCSVFSDITIEASGKLGTSTTASLARGTYTITLSAAGDWKNGQVIRIPGAGGLIPLKGTTVSTTAGSAVVTVSGLNTFGRGIHGPSLPGNFQQYFVIGTAFPNYTKCIASTVDGSNYTITMTMASNAATTLTNVVPSLAFDCFAQIQSGGGTTTLTIDSACDEGNGFAPAPWSGSVALNDMTIFHADTALYCKALITARDCTFGSSGKGFQGASVSLRGSPADNPIANVDDSCFDNCTLMHSFHGLHYAGNDANRISAHNCKAISCKSWGFVDGGGLGSSFYNCLGDQFGTFLTGPSSACATAIFGSYAEGGSTCAFGDGTNVIGGSLPIFSGGYVWIGAFANRMTMGLVSGAGAYTSHQTEFDPTTAWLKVTSTASQVYGIQFRRSNAGQDGVDGWALFSHSSNVVGMKQQCTLIADHDCSTDVPGTRWEPNGFIVGGASASAGSVVRANGRKWAFGGAIPTTGTWAKGDRVYNDGSAGQVVDFWYCTTAGGPGVFVFTASNA